MLRIIAIAILVYVAIRFLIRLFVPTPQRSSSGSASRPGDRKERHQKGDVIIEYQKPSGKKPKVDADDVDFEVIE